jgi:hypothetical protein
MSDAARLGLVGGTIAIILSVAVFLWTGGGFFILFFAAAPAFAYLFGGAPRLIEVHHDRIVLRYWLRRARTLLARDLAVQQMSDEVILIHDGSTYGIDAAYFPSASFREFIEAVRPIAKTFVAR